MTENFDRVDSEKKGFEGNRVLILFPHMVTVGGALHYTLHLAEQLQRRGATVAILALRTDRSVVPPPAGVELLCLEGPLTSQLSYWARFFYWQKKINRTVRGWQADVLVPQAFPSNWWGWLYKKQCPTAKIAWICHEPSAFIHSLPWIRAIRPRWKGAVARLIRPFLAAFDVSLVRRSDRIIANSQFTASEIRRVYNLEPDAVAYPGIEVKPAVGVGSRLEPAVITVARLTRFKRVDFLLRVFSGVLKSHPTLKYHIVGTGEEESSLRLLAGQLGLESRVIFHGAATDEKLDELYRSSSLFLHGSVDEPFGMAPLEAIACGTPVVAHCSGGPREFVDDSCGRLIPSLQLDDWIEGVTDCLELMVRDPEWRESVSHSARQFAWEVSLRPAVDVITRLCQGA